MTKQIEKRHPVETAILYISLLVPVTFFYLLVWNANNDNGQEWRESFGIKEKNFLGIEYPNKIKNY